MLRLNHLTKNILPDANKKQNLQAFNMLKKGLAYFKTELSNKEFRDFKTIFDNLERHQYSNAVKILLKQDNYSINHLAGYMSMEDQDFPCQNNTTINPSKAFWDSITKALDEELKLGNNDIEIQKMSTLLALEKTRFSGVYHEDHIEATLQLLASEHCTIPGRAYRALLNELFDLDSNKYSFDTLISIGEDANKLFPSQKKNIISTKLLEVFQEEAFKDLTYYGLLSSQDCHNYKQLSNLINANKKDAAEIFLHDIFENDSELLKKFEIVDKALLALAEKKFISELDKVDFLSSQSKMKNFLLSTNSDFQKIKRNYKPASESVKSGRIQKTLNFAHMQVNQQVQEHGFKNKLIAEQIKGLPKNFTDELSKTSINKNSLLKHYAQKYQLSGEMPKLSSEDILELVLNSKKVFSHNGATRSLFLPELCDDLVIKTQKVYLKPENINLKNQLTKNVKDHLDKTNLYHSLDSKLAETRLDSYQKNYEKLVELARKNDIYFLPIQSCLVKGTDGDARVCTVEPWLPEVYSSNENQSLDIFNLDAVMADNPKLVSFFHSLLTTENLQDMSWDTMGSKNLLLVNKPEHIRKIFDLLNIQSASIPKQIILGGSSFIKVDNLNMNPMKLELGDTPDSFTEEAYKKLNTAELRENFPNTLKNKIKYAKYLSAVTKPIIEEYENASSRNKKITKAMIGTFLSGPCLYVLDSVITKTRAPDLTLDLDSKKEFAVNGQSNLEDLNPQKEVEEFFKKMMLW